MSIANFDPQAVNENPWHFDSLQLPRYVVASDVVNRSIAASGIVTSASTAAS